MRSPPGRAMAVIAASLALAAAGSCASLVSSVEGDPPLFPGSGDVQKVDFEDRALNEPPEGFETRIGRWSVADSPTAVSGTQVLVRGGEGAAELVPKDAEGVVSAGSEVSVRIFLGAPGAGIWCDADRGKAGYLLKLEPDARRIALYRKSADSMTNVDQAAISASKGEWTRLGLLCQSDRVIGYLDGKPAVKDRGAVPPFDLALYADPGVTAQFDDFKYWTVR
jgi:hypothetical protein